MLYIYNVKSDERMHLVARDNNDVIRRVNVRIGNVVIFVLLETVTRILCRVYIPFRCKC